jgi:iron complex outermembrane receptor protein
MKSSYHLLALALAFISAAAVAQESPYPTDLFVNDPAEPTPMPSAETQDASEEQLATIPVEPLTPGPEATPVPRPSDRPMQLEEIVVTATKRARQARDLPVSINAMHGDDLEKIGARDLKDFISQAPGVTLQDGNNGEAGNRKITVRGVGPSTNGGLAGNQPVGQFIGDVPMTDPYSNFVTPDLDPFDLKTVEILKGPQGTTFGASALNGAIRYVPNDPELDLWSGRGFVDHVSFSEGGSGLNYGGMLNAPLGDTAALRLIGISQDAPGVIDNLASGEADADSRRKWTGRGLLRWEPGENWVVTASYLQQHSEVNDSITADNTDGRLESSAHLEPSPVEVDFSLASLDARYEFEELGTLVLQSSRQTKEAVIDLDLVSNADAGIQVARAYGNYNIDGMTHELRLVSPDGGGWNWIVGAFLLDYEAEAIADAYIVNTDGLGLPTNLPESIYTPRGLSILYGEVTPIAKEKSLYGEIERRFGEYWEVTLGGRYYRTEINGRQKLSGLLSTIYLASGSRETVVDQQDSGFSPKLAITFKPADHWMLYAAVARGFQFGGVNGPPILSLPFDNPFTGVPVPLEYNSSTIWSRELGVRTDWFDRTLRVDLTLFDLDWTDAQFGQSSGGSIANNVYTDNVGEVRSQGAEMSFAWITPIPGLAINLTGAYIRARTAADYEDGSGEVIRAGREMPASPNVQTSASLAWTGYFDGWIPTASLSHTYLGPAWANIRHTDEIYDYQTLSLNLSLARPDWPGAPALAVGVNNLTDERGLAGIGGAVDGGALDVGNPKTWIYSRPRSVSVRLTAEF